MTEQAPTALRDILKRAGTPIPPENKQHLARVEEEIHEALDARRAAYSDLYRIAHLIYNIKHGDMIILSEELHGVNPEKSPTSPEDISKLLFGWAESKMKELLPENQKKD